MSHTVFSPTALAVLIEKAPKDLPQRFDCTCRDRYQAAALSSRLLRLDFTCVIDATTYRLEARGAQPSTGKDYHTVMCSECGVYPADQPSRLCPGCEAYREHQS